MTTITNQNIPKSILNAKPSKNVVVAKFIVVAVLVAGLVAAAFFGGSAFLALIASGAALWKVCLVGTGCAAVGVAIFGASYFAAKHKMFDDTSHNVKDSLKFAGETLCTPFYLVHKTLVVLKEVVSWLLLKE